MSAIANVPLTSSSRSSSVTTGPVLVASDGSAVSHEALFNAGRLASSAFGGAIEIIGVCEPMPGVAAGMDVLPVPPELDEARRTAMLDDLRRSVNIAAAGDPAWPINVLIGSPPRTLAQEADRRGAALIVMGIGRHNPLDRLFGTETTLATLRESRTPVLAVGPNFPAAPIHAVVGLDFSASSVQAAHLALRLLAPGGRLTLVHVRPRFEHPSADWQAWDADYSRTLPPLFEQISAQLEVPAGITVETVTVRGDPAPALLAYAQQTNADLVAVGTQHHSLFERLMVGSVATRVLRTARVGVLAVPQVAPAS
jgi:nucleotide-binding universal stress UspA family protein